MAQLTTTLDDPTRGKPIIEPAQPGPSFLGGLAQLVSGGISAAVSNHEYNLTEDRRKAANEIEQNMLNIRTSYDEQSQGAAQDEIINQMNLGLNDTDKVRKAAQQGKVPLDAVDAKVESMYSSMFQKYPDQKSFIADYFKSRGYDHYLGRELSLAEASRAQSDKDRLDMEHAYYQAGVKAGATPGSDDGDIMDLGRRFIAAQAQLEQSKTLSEIARNNAETDKTRADLLEKQARQTAQDGIVSTVMAYGGNATSAFDKLYQAAGDDPQKLDQLQKEVLPAMVSNLQSQYERLVQNAIASGALHADQRAPIDEDFKNRLQFIQDRYFGNFSTFAADKRSFEQFQQFTQMDAAKAAPMWTMVKNILGPQTAQLLFNGDPTKALNPDFITQLKTELQTFNPLRPNKAIGLISQAGEILAGNKDINEVKPNEYDAAHLQIFSGAMNANAPNAIGAKGTPDAKQSFLNGTGALSVITTRAIQPNYRNVDGWAYAVDNIANPTNVAALTSLQNDAQFGPRAKEVMTASRAAVEQVLLSANYNANGIKFNGTKFVAQPNQATAKQVANAGSPAAMGAIMKNAGQIDPQTQKQADTMNKALDFLMKTSQYDENAKGMAPALLAQHYASGTPLPEGGAAKKEASTKDKNFSDSVAEFEKGLQKSQIDLEKQVPYREYNANRNQLQPTIERAARANGLNPAFMSQLVEEESSWNPNADAHATHPESHAYGLMQVQPGTMELMGYKPEDRMDLNKNVDAGMRYFKSLLDKHGGNYVEAAKEYGGNSYSPKVYDRLIRSLGR